MTVSSRIAVVGAGAFGTALASVAAASGGDVTLIGRNAEAVAAMRTTRRNEKVLPGIDLPETLAFSADAEVVRGAGIVLFAMPSQAQREAARSLAPLLAPGTAVVICAKGMEKGSGRLLTDVLEEELPGREIAVLSGPGFAADIAKGLHIPMNVAERIKTKHGGVHATSKDDRDMIEIGGDSGDWEKDLRQVSRTELIGIMRPRVEEILEEARARLDAAGFDHLPSQQIVLTGGGSQLMGLDGLAARILGQRVRLGRPLRIQGLPQAVTGPAFSSAVGLCLFATHPQDEWWDFDIPTEKYPARSLRRAIKWFRDNW